MNLNLNLNSYMWLVAVILDGAGHDLVILNECNSAQSELQTSHSPISSYSSS